MMATRGKYEWCLCFIITVFLQGINGQDMPTNSMEQRIATLETQGKQEVKELRTMIAEQEKTIAALENKVDSQNVLMMEMMTTLMKGHATTDKRLTQLNDKHEGMRQNRIIMDAEGPVAFQATMKRPNTTVFGVGQELVFDAVSLNVGGGYNNQNGVFTAPQAGMYIFSTSVMSYYQPFNEIWVGIYKNGARIAHAFAHGDNSRDQGSVTIASQLAVGDVVSVKIDKLAQDTFRELDFNSFMGCMVMYI